MPNLKYNKGRKKEYKICKELREQGFNIVQRSAGSHSPIDIWAVSKKYKVIKLIQVKPDEFNKKKLEKELSWLNDYFQVEVEVR